MASASDMPLSDEHRRQRGKNYALGGFLLALVILFFVVTLVKMGAQH